MARCLAFALLFLALALFLLPSRTAAAAAAAPLTLRDLLHIVLPHNYRSPQEATPDHLLRGVTTSTAASTEDDDYIEEVVGGAEARVDFGTKSWPYVYYARRDQKGTVDWGTMSWPYVYYSRRDSKGHKEGNSSDADAAAAGTGSAVKPPVAAVRHGRKVGAGGTRV